METGVAWGRVLSGRSQSIKRQIVLLLSPPLQFVPLTARPSLWLLLTCFHRSDILHLGRDRVSLQQFAGLATPLTHIVKHQSIWPCMAISKLSLRDQRGQSLCYPSQQCFLIRFLELWPDRRSKFSSPYKVPGYGWQQGRTVTSPYTAQGLVTPITQSDGLRAACVPSELFLHIRGRSQVAERLRQN